MAAREQWRSGLGSFWLLPAAQGVHPGASYHASQGGGGLLVLYLLIVLVVCLPVLVAEMVLGRSTGRALLAPVQAVGRLR